MLIILVAQCKRVLNVIKKHRGSSSLGTMISLFHRISVPSWYLAKSRTWLEEPITWITLRCRRHCISVRALYVGRLPREILLSTLSSRCIYRTLPVSHPSLSLQLHTLFLSFSPSPFLLFLFLTRKKNEKEKKNWNWTRTKEKSGGSCTMIDRSIIILMDEIIDS